MSRKNIAGSKLLVFNARQKMRAAELLHRIAPGVAALIIFDPQYRALLDRQRYGNEGARQKARARLPQMTDDDIRPLVSQAERVLRASGHMILWVDKFSVATAHWSGYFRAGTSFRVVDLIAWNKLRIGMGRRSRCVTEYAVILQKVPTRAKGIWTDRRIPDCWPEQQDRDLHAHAKPRQLMERLVRAVTKRGDLVVDPCAGGYGVLDICRETGRRFVGCDVI